ncbi:VOC family protein [Piscinibacter gummiphilus]|uniref:VOC family protein n=1 Tax=Piscinibacter gummiphilus TaxID=946333 RepID=A0ABZ0CSB6_9BURK|nr:VOC family protein [Piscinibacter gummiphilus]WOB07879.1 VOC family protein [Piscinibacter gummiphilus]
MPACRIDHITITAPTLAAGSDLVFESLGVRPQPGGEHPRMGTHNLLLRLGDALFLEVIAVNPAAPAPSRPRWFELDRISPETPPRLACWVARTDDILGSLQRCSAPMGPAETQTRGTLEWRITIPEDGHLPFGGAAPALIQWHAATHPARGLHDVGCSLVALELLHPDTPALSTLLDELQVVEPGVELSVREAAVPAIVAHIHTPHGIRRLGPQAPLGWH